MFLKVFLVSTISLIASSCSHTSKTTDHRESAAAQNIESKKIEFYGTLEPFAQEAIYFVLTDRFVDGDTSNNYPKQGGENHTFDRPLHHADGSKANIGYLGGDYQGILNNAKYIKKMGFTAIWLSPIVQNPDESFTGGYQLGEHMFADKNKTGYHGYWGVNFFEEDEHWGSETLDFRSLTQQLKQKYQLKTVLDIVANHGSPSFTMPYDQPMYGEIYDQDGRLIADHQNLPPEKLDKNNPLHQLFHTSEDIAQLSNLNENKPQLVDYFTRAYLHWIDAGADAFRIDTIRHMPHHFWKTFSDNIRQEHPGFFMFGESYEFNAEKIAEHTLPENGTISVLDFPGREKMQAVFENNAPMTELLDYLHLGDSIYNNPYDLATFYDNHDMSRLNATDNNFINANNWLFTSRGIPVVYYGSEIGFMRGKKEHYGNRNYFGQKNIELAKKHPITQSLSRIANIRRQSIALQKGLQFNLSFGKNHASFLRVFQYEGKNEIALVLLNRHSESQIIQVDDYLNQGEWYDVTEQKKHTINGRDHKFEVVGNGVKVLIIKETVNNKNLLAALKS